MAAQIPGALGDPLPAPAITENTWASIGAGHRLIYIGADSVLDWVPASGAFRVWRIDRNPAAGADPLPGSPVCQGTWVGILADHDLVYLGGDRLLDWQPLTSRFRVWLINRAAVGNADPESSDCARPSGLTPRRPRRSASRRRAQEAPAKDFPETISRSSFLS